MVKKISKTENKTYISDSLDISREKIESADEFLKKNPLQVILPLTKGSLIRVSHSSYTYLPFKSTIIAHPFLPSEKNRKKKNKRWY
jgi:hypothetical protein